MTPTMISVAIFMVGVSVAVIVWLQGYRVAGSARRMAGMMTRVGVDPAAATPGDPRATTTVREMRRRCMRCPHEDVCDRWLAGKIEGGNTFCPNAQEFGILGGPVVHAG